jgi:hypothetical protein
LIPPQRSRSNAPGAGCQKGNGNPQNAGGGIHRRLPFPDEANEKMATHETAKNAVERIS